MDSIGYDLSEIVVEGRSQRAIENGVEYIPGKKMKKVAMDAVSLLTLMQIPQLSVSPIDKSVTMINNASVSFFINYVPASPEELDGLRPENVKAVEILDFPTDPRFAGADHVVNFIISLPEWGGYTKASLRGETLGVNNIGGGLYEKFTYRNWMFDANVSAGGTRNKKAKDYKKETFRDFMFEDREVGLLERITDTDYSDIRNNSENAAIRASYNNNRGMYLGHTVSFSRIGTPRGLQSGNIAFSAPILPSTEYEQNNTSTSNNASIKGYYQFALPKENFLITDWSFSYSANKNMNSYALGNLAPIITDINEKSYTPDATIFYSKRLKHRNSLRVMLNSYAHFYDTRYSGESLANQRLTSSESMVFLEYLQNFEFGLNLYTRLGASYVYGKLNHATISSDWNPRLGVSLDYSINSNHHLNAEGWWANSAPRPAWTNDATVRQDELIWIAGNPDMRNVYGPMSSVTYTYIPVNMFSIAASARYDVYRHGPIYVYAPTEGYDGLIRSFSDDNTEKLFSVSLSATARLLRNSLILNARGTYKRESLSGILPMSRNDFTGSAFASYYFGNMALTMYYDSPSTSILSRLGTSFHAKSSYGLMINYSIGNLKAELSFRNWFSKGRVYERYASATFCSDGWRWIQGRARRLELSLTYTFNYGKNVERNDDLENIAKKNSAILE
ncbi:MAG: hypothetical protein HDS82_03405 [Bacteroidales bacterium]|nr:hypothetical protein [Bacteroidales bacterium]